MLGVTGCLALPASFPITLLAWHASGTTIRSLGCSATIRALLRVFVGSACSFLPWTCMPSPRLRRRRRNMPAACVKGIGRRLRQRHPPCLLLGQLSPRETNYDNFWRTRLRFPSLPTPRPIRRCFVGPLRKLGTAPASRHEPRSPLSGAAESAELSGHFARGSGMYSRIIRAGRPAPP